MHALKKSLIVFLSASLTFSPPLHANPTGGTVVAGNAQIGAGANGTLTITQGSNSAIIHWNGFSINAGETTRFEQPNAASAVLNRVTGGNPSALLGKLEANGSVYLINPNGVLVGPNGVINTGGSFVASTRNISNDAFLAGGDLHFAGDSAAGVENLGFIKSAAGDVILVGRTVKNAGAIEATQGMAGLAAGDDVLLSATGSDRLSVRLPVSATATAETGVDNSGTVKAAQAQLTAAGGNVYALAINNGGVIEATGFARRADGRIVLGTDGGAIAVSGKLSARDADGSGGTIFVGGGYQGKDAAVPNARTTTVAATATLDADAATAGNGGQVIVWADDRTEFHGAISARGGATGGDGGFVEVSGKQDLLFKGTADTRAPAGATGTLLLDPANITVDVTSLAVGTGANALSMSDLSLQLQTNNVTISTSTRPGTDAGDITFIGTTSGPFNFPNALTFNADRDILFNAPLIIAATSNQGAITFNAGNDIKINQPLLFRATSQGGNASGTTAGTTGANVSFGAVRFASGNDIFLNAPLLVTASSTGGNAADAPDLSNGGTGAGGAGGNLTFSGLTLSAGGELLVRNNLDVDVSSIGGTGGRGFFAGPADPGVNPTTLGAGGAGGNIMLGEILLQAGMTQTSQRLIVQSSNGSSGTPAALTFDFTSRGGDGGDKALGGRGGAGGAITSHGITLAANAANHSNVWMADGTTFAVKAASQGGIGGDALGFMQDITFPSSLKTLAIGGSGGAINLGDTTFSGDAVKLYAQSLTLDATVRAGVGGYNDFDASYSGGTGGNAGSAQLGTLRFTAAGGIYDTPLLTRSRAIVDVPVQQPATNGSGSASAANVTASPFSLTSVAGPITLGAHGIGSSVFYSDSQIEMISGQGMSAGGGAISTKQALFLVVDNQNPANPGLNSSVFLDLSNALIQAGPGAAMPTFNSGTNQWNGSQIADYIRFYTIDPAHTILPAGFTPPNDFRGANTYYNTGLLAGVVPGIFYKNIILRDPLTVTADSFNKLYGAALPVFTATYSGFVNGNTIANFTLPTFTTAATMGSNVGTYSITPGGMTGPANYSFNYIPGTLTINPASLTVTANNATTTYGFGALPSFGTTVSGLVNGDTATSVVTANPTTTATVGANAGTYVIAPGATLLGSTPNYTLSQVNGALTVDTATLNVAANDASKLYGAALPALTGTASGLVNGNTQAAVVSFTPTVTATAGSNVGTYAIAPNATLLTGNYALGTVANGVLTINPSTLNVQANNASTTYGAAIPGLTGSALNLVNADTQAAVVSFAPTTTAALGSNAGTYTIIPNASLLTGNYLLGTQTNGTLTINPATLNIAANNASKVYGAALPVFTGTATGLVNSDTQAAVVSFANAATTATAGSNVGSYTITPNALLLTGNYVLGTQANGMLTIDPAALQVSANNVSRAFGAANPAFTASYNGLVNGDTAAVVSGLSLSTTATPASAAGSYAITQSGALSATNYTLTFAPGTLTVGNPDQLTIAANNATATYGFSALPAFSATYNGFVNGDTTADVTGLQFFTTAAVGANAGAYTITPFGATAPSNYAVSYTNGVLTINPATLNVAANNASKLYGAALPVFTATVTGLVNGNTQAAVVSLANATTTATAGSNVGTYTITPNASLLTSNYVIGTETNGVLTINPATLNVAANNAVKVYGAALPVFTGTATGLVNGNTQASVVSFANATTTATAGSNVGSYTIMPNATLLTTNYVLGTQTNGTLTINRAPLQVSANNLSRAYGFANPALTAAYNGLVNGDTSAAVSGLSLSTAATTASAAGNYAITQSGALTAANYTITFAPGTLTVGNPNPLTIAANNASATYGFSALPTFTASYTGFVNGNTAANVTGLQFFTNAALGANAGAYTITPFGATAPANYIVSYVNGTLTINPATLNVTANNAVKVYGATLPVFTGTATGLVNGNTQASVVSFANAATTATAGSNVGSYTITPNATLLTTNYVLGTQTNGTLTIDPAVLHVTANDASKAYGAALPAFTAAYNGLVNGDTSAVVSGLALATTATPASAAGSYAITQSGPLSATNYTITFAPGTLTVGNPNPLTIAANNASATYGFSALPTFTANYSGFVNGNTAANVTGLQFSTNAAVGANAGTYTLTPFGATAPSNYIVSYVNGTLTINPATLNVAANNVGKVYGAALPVFTGTATGLVNGNTQASVVSFANATTTATAGSNVGSYTIAPNATLLSTNYVLGTQTNGTLTINPATLNVAANNASKIYGAALPVLTGTATGLVNGDAQASVVSFANAATAATVGSNVGSYTITPSASLLTSNYILGTQTNGALTINPATLNIAANNAAGTYGSVLPVFTGTASGLVNGDTQNAVLLLNFTSTATAGSNAGTYAITPSASLFGLTPNYVIGSLTPGALTINRAPLTITADSFSRARDTANPAFTASYSGLVNGDTTAVVSGLAFTTGATTSSAAGTYAITPGSATASNYAISFVPGTLIVRGLLGLTLTAADASRIYGDANPTFSLKSADGLLAGDSVASVQFKTDAALGSNVGRYAITPFGAVVATAVPREYDISYLPGTLTINPATLTVSLNGAMLHRSARSWQSIGGLESVTTTDDSLTGTSRYLVNGGGADSFTYTIDGFKNSADVGSVDLASAAAFSSSANGPLMAQGGLKLNGAAAGNYTFDFKSYTPEVFGYVPTTTLTLTTLAANAYPDSKIILPAIMLYDPALTFFDAARGKRAVLGEFSGDGTNYYNQAQLAGLSPGYETNWSSGAPVGTYWTLPTLAGLESGITNPVPNQSYEVGTPFYFPDLANPGREFAVTKVRVGIVNVFTRDNVPPALTQTKLLVEQKAGVVYANQINVGPIGAFGVPIAAQDVLYDIVDRMLADAKIDVGPNRVQGVSQWILANGNSPEMRNALTAYMTQEAIKIVTSGRARTTGEQVFLDALTNQINENRADAANEALGAYNQWKADQAAFRENMRGYGALLNLGDRIPPEVMALAVAQIPSEQILKVSGVVTGVVSGAGGAAMLALTQNAGGILETIMPYASIRAANLLPNGLAVAGGAAGAAPIANVVATLATIGMAIERIVSADADQKAFDKAIAALSQPTSIEGALGMQMVIGGTPFTMGMEAPPTYKDQYGTTWEFTRTQNNLALMAAVTATIDTSGGPSFANSSLGGRQ